MTIQEMDMNDTLSMSGVGTAKLNSAVGSTKKSNSTASIVDQAEAMSTITGSSSAFTSTKVMFSTYSKT